MNVQILDYTVCEHQPGCTVSENTLPHYRLFFINSGAYTFQIDTREFSCKHGECMILPPNTHCTIRVCSSVCAQCAVFEVAQFPPSVHLPSVTFFGASQKMLYYLEEFDLEWTQHDPNREHILSALMTLILCELQRINQKHQSSNHYVTEAQEYISEHLSESIRVEDIAAVLNLNPFYFGTLFKKHTGKSVISYINEQKIEKAAQLLLRSRITISEVAKQTGFSDVYYFSRIFKKLHGISPSSYQKQHHRLPQV